ncbi:hypothetical protein OJ252_3426 [Cryptosporidium canis]|uniref:Uncharacterized protein n=1 Tax=Cryptosporidium canis TaxID=195482 RepID=A0ABQ8P4U8_9CRYT|nr:hypothetical protein OJ252_3426 [Cryptosporidium canis]
MRLTFTISSALAFLGACLANEFDPFYMPMAQMHVPEMPPPPTAMTGALSNIYMSGPWMSPLEQKKWVESLRDYKLPIGYIPIMRRYQRLKESSIVERTRQWAEIAAWRFQSDPKYANSPLKYTVKDFEAMFQKFSAFGWSQEACEQVLLDMGIHSDSIEVWCSNIEPWGHDECADLTWADFVLVDDIENKFRGKLEQQSICRLNRLRRLPAEHLGSQRPSHSGDSDSGGRRDHLQNDGLYYDSGVQEGSAEAHPQGSGAGSGLRRGHISENARLQSQRRLQDRLGHEGRGEPDPGVLQKRDDLSAVEQSRQHGGDCLSVGMGHHLSVRGGLPGGLQEARKETKGAGGEGRDLDRWLLQPHPVVYYQMVEGLSDRPEAGCASFQ